MDQFDREFCGLFLGEGCIDVSQQGRLPRHLRPRVRIGMNSREMPLLEAVKDRYGGSLTFRRANDSVSWQLTGATGLTRVAGILEASVLPSCKRAEIALLGEAIGLRANPVRMAEIQAELSRLKHPDRARYGPLTAD